MPYSIRWESKQVYAKFSGKGAVSEVLAVFAEIAGDPRLDELESAIFDYLEVEHQNVNEEEVEEIAALQAALNFSKQNILFASVSTDDKIRELWRHFALFHSEITNMEGYNAIFSNVADAKDWIAKRLPNIRARSRF